MRMRMRMTMRMIPPYPEHENVAGLKKFVIAAAAA
jgi:hypothetical protein